MKKLILGAEGKQGGRSRNAEYILHIIKVSLDVIDGRVLLNSA